MLTWKWLQSPRRKQRFFYVRRWFVYRFCVFASCLARPRARCGHGVLPACFSLASLNDYDLSCRRLLDLRESSGIGDGSHAFLRLSILGDHQVQDRSTDRHVHPRAGCQCLSFGSNADVLFCAAAKSAQETRMGNGNLPHATLIRVRP